MAAPGPSCASQSGGVVQGCVGETGRVVAKRSRAGILRVGGTFRMRSGCLRFSVRIANCQGGKAILIQLFPEQ
jgi:hypothetical protein